MAVPKNDAPLVNYSTNFNTRGVAAPTDFSLTSGQMALYTPLHEAWIAAYAACNVAGGKNPALCAAKDQAKRDLLPYARELYAQVQNSLTVSDENKLLMGVTIRKTEPSRRPAPALAPLLTGGSVTGRVCEYKLADQAFPTTNRRPTNAEGATIMSFVGANPPPAGSPGWKLEGQTGKLTFSVEFGNDVAPGTPCHVTALWYSARGEYSPAAVPVQTYLQVGPVVEAV